MVGEGAGEAGLGVSGPGGALGGLHAVEGLVPARRVVRLVEGVIRVHQAGLSGIG